MITSIGSFLRKLRLENNEILKNMAERLEVSSAFLSAVENGKKKMPETWYDKLTTLYSLNDQQREAMIQAALDSSDTVELNIQNASPFNRQLAVSFARQFETLDEDISLQIFNILNKHKED